MQNLSASGTPWLVPIKMMMLAVTIGITHTGRTSLYNHENAGFDQLPLLSFVKRKQDFHRAVFIFGVGLYVYLLNVQTRTDSAAS